MTQQQEYHALVDDVPEAQTPGSAQAAEQQPILPGRTDAAHLSDYDEASDEDEYEDAAHGVDEQGFATATLTPVASSSSTASQSVPAPSHASARSSSGSGKAAMLNSRSSPNDGVFANLAAKPEASSASSSASASTGGAAGAGSDDAPPAYDTVGSDRAPEYPPMLVVTAPQPGQDADDTIVNGRPVGGLASYLLSLLVALSFQSVGFLLAFMFSTTHAGKEGAKTGIGLFLIQIGISIRQQADNVFVDDHGDYASGQDAGSPSPMPTWIAYVFLLVGWFTVVESMSAFLRVRRLRQIIRTQPNV